MILATFPGSASDRKLGGGLGMRLPDPAFYFHLYVDVVIFACLCLFVLGSCMEISFLSYLVSEYSTVER